jgi:hypothetical protein
MARLSMNFSGWRAEAAAEEEAKAKAKAKAKAAVGLEGSNHLGLSA